ncbi:MAG: hypothetical protein AAFP92_14565, partial [Bacteroidota bacterium]
MYKHSFLMALCLGCASLLWSQPTLDSSIMLGIGDRSPVQMFSQGQGVFDPGPAGPNQNWDFSTVSPVGEAFEWVALEPSETSWGSSFPTATLAVELPGDSTQDTRYYHFDGQQLNFLGYVAVLSGNQADTFSYDLQANPALEIAFPATYQQSWQDTASGSSQVTVGGMTLTLDRTMYRTLVADGYGSLTTPLGTFSNVLRIRMEEKVEDKVFGQVTSTQDNARYFWYAPQEKYLLLQMDSLVLHNAGGSFPSFSMFYRSGEVMTSLAPQLLPHHLLKAYPNPAKEAIWLAVEGQAIPSWQVEVLSLTGQR